MFSVGALIALCAVFSVFVGAWSVVASLLLGYGFSVVILIQLMQAQVAVLQEKNRMAYFRYFLLRLFCYITPVSLAFFYPSYFHFSILLICLMANQIFYIVSMLIRSVKKSKYKKI